MTNPDHSTSHVGDRAPGFGRAPGEASSADSAFDIRNLLGPKAPMPPRLDLPTIRATLAGVRGQEYWRSLDEVAETEEFKEMLYREFPDGASEWPDGFSRRSFLKLAAASLALAGLSACTKQPIHEIVPYVKQPENLVLGDPMYYATAMLLGGYATGVLAKSREGHPIKVDGNPEHPACLGSSSVWMQASILDLYDPDRSQAVTHHGEISTWAAFLSDLNRLVREHEASQGAGLRFLTETVTSPTITAQLDELLRRFPKAKVHQFDPVSRDNVRAGAQLAFGEVVETHYRFEKAAVILSLDSDFLYTHPQRLRYTRDFSNGRRVSQGRREMNRLYVAESTPSVTGTMAEHRLPLPSGEVENLACEIARNLGGIPTLNLQQFARDSAWIQAVCHDLEAHRAKSIVIAGEWQPPLVHAIAHLLNDKLGNVGATVFYTSPAEPHPVQQLQSLRELLDDMKSGKVETLFILSGNPVYSAPADFDFRQLLSKVNCSVHLGSHLNETALACNWHIAEAHYLESWGDARSFDGTITLLQPLIAPLYDGKTDMEVLDAMRTHQGFRGSYDIVREHWRSKLLWPDFDKAWRQAVCDGFIADSSLPERPVALRTDDVLAALRQAASQSSPSPAHNDAPDLELTFRPDPCIWDGRFANNGWLQECAKPVNKLTWDNAILISAALAQRSQLTTGDVVELSCQNRSLHAPVWVMPGQAENSLTLHLGYGRKHVGRVGAGVGFNAYLLRTSRSFWRATGVTLKKLDRRHNLVSTQTHHNLHSPDRQVHRQGTLAQFLADPDFVKKTVEAPKTDDTLYYPNEFKYEGYKWGMSIDLNTCIGCNACLVACEVENNIPVVGKAQVNLKREMYWIRIDTYHRGTLDNPEFSHMPVPCMHCEHAPCELVCPVEATVHDHEGLNLMVYNRCVGTRFCSNNCPYKVRRFNFLRYTDYHTPSLKPMYNPEVTVRWRGVMEKCTYCVQRIAAGRIRAEKEDRRIRDGEVRTACQVACPAQAIIFGDLNTPDSQVAGLKVHPLDYAMLGELNVRPRTTYLAKLRNPGPLGERPAERSEGKAA